MLIGRIAYLISERVAAVMRKGIVLIAIVLIAIGGFLVVRTYDSDVGVQAPLTPTNTVHDFHVASKSARSRWLEEMCDDGVCLDPIDWKCGFSFTSTEASDLK